MTLNPLDYPVCFSTPKRLAPSTWIQHVPFAMFLVDILRPKMIVELGTYYGTSYCAFCQAVDELKIAARCYAIDTWRGDPQSGFFGDEVLADLRAHHDPLYSDISTLIQAEFDWAIERFQDHSIDLLHIDGYHTYDDVKHDFELWLPKMSSSGVILLHDIVVHRDDFGAWKVWDEIKTSSYPTFELANGYGLGLVAVGDSYPPALKLLFDSSNEQRHDIRHFFFQLGRSAEALQQLGITEGQLHEQEQTVIRLQNEYQQETNRLQNEYQQETTRLQNEHQQETTRLQNEYQQETTRLQNEHQQETNRLQNEHQQTASRLKSDYQEILYQQEQQLGLVASQKMTIEQQLNAVNQRLSLVDQEIGAAYQRMNQALQDLETRQAEVDQLKKSLAQAPLMPQPKDILRGTWRSLVPRRVRDWVWRLRKH